MRNNGDYMDKVKPTPVVKWAGGKRQLLPEIQSILPTKYGTYYEPFFGGGALYFDLLPKKAVINDFNPLLMNVYLQIRDNAKVIYSLLSDLDKTYNRYPTDAERTKYYYSLRDSFNDCIRKNKLSEYTAALFIFLNKAGFNGLYRVNKSGLYNVPPAHRKEIHSGSQENIFAVSDALSKTTILTGDFEDSLKGIRKGDLVFFDSPYYDTFDTYQPGGFSMEDHIRLCHLYDRLTEKGIYCILTNNDCDFIKELYKEYHIKEIPVKRMINCDGQNRVGKEVIITNYKL